MEKYEETIDCCAKLTGAGMGGYVLILSKQNKNIEEENIEAKVSEKGLLVEFKELQKNWYL